MSDRISALSARARGFLNVHVLRRGGGGAATVNGAGVAPVVASPTPVATPKPMPKPPIRVATPTAAVVDPAPSMNPAAKPLPPIPTPVPTPVTAIPTVPDPVATTPARVPKPLPPTPVKAGANPAVADPVMATAPVVPAPVVVAPVVAAKVASTPKDKEDYEARRKALAQDEAAVARIGALPADIKLLRDAWTSAAAAQKVLTDDGDYAEALKQMPALEKAVKDAIKARRAAVEKATTEQCTAATSKLDLVGASGKAAWKDVGSAEWKSAVDAVLDLKMDEDFSANYDEISAGVGAELAKDPVVKEAFDNWKDWAKNGEAIEANKEKLTALMKHVVAVQCKHLGIDPPTPVETFVNLAKPGLYGGFSGSDKKMSINLGNSSIDDFREVLDTLTHENTHAYQRKLIDAKQAGTLKPGSPEYAAASVFEVNTNKGYVTSSESAQYPGKNAYMDQVKETHAWRGGAKAGKAAYDAIAAEKAGS